MSRVTVKDNLPSFTKQMKSVFNDALRETAVDILVEAKMKAPLKHGLLRSPHEPIKRLTNGYAVGFDARYAAYQEAGGDGNRVIRHYTTADTGKHFLENSGDRYAGSKIVGKFKKHSQRISI